MRKLSFTSRSMLILFCLLLLLSPGPSEGFDLRRDKIAGTHYTGSTWAPTFWSNLNIHDVSNDLAEIRENGFNTIILVVPWMGFQTDVEPVAYYEEYFQLLEEVMAIAGKENLRVILRVGYAHDVGPESKPVHLHRIARLLMDENMMSAWLQYLDRVNAIAEKHDNFLFGFISWEDFYLLHFGLGYAGRPEKDRLYIAEKLGYQDFLKKYTLEEIGAVYGKTFSAYTDIPVEGNTAKSIVLFYEFWDHYLIRLVRESRKHFPTMSMEARVDCDPSPGRKPGKIKYICHDETFDAGGDVTVIYYTSAWGGKNQGDLASAEEAAARLEYLIKKIESATDKRIFIDQFNFIDNTPGFERNTRIDPRELNDFLDRSAAVIHDRTIGMALWTMKDLRANVIKNGGFERGDMGWRIENGRLSREEGDANAELLLQGDGSAHQALRVNFIHHSNFYRLAFRARRVGDAPSRLGVKLFDSKGTPLFEKETVVEAGAFTPIAMESLPLIKQGAIEFTNRGGDVLLDDIVLHHRIQENGVYDVDGAPRPFLDGLLSMNRQLTAPRQTRQYYAQKDFPGAGFDGLYDDGWVGASLSGQVRMPLGSDKNRFSISLYIPENWAGYRNSVSVKINGRVAGAFSFGPGLTKNALAVTADDRKTSLLSFEIVPRKTFTAADLDPASKDIRPLSFVLIGAGFAE